MNQIEQIINKSKENNFSIDLENKHTSEDTKLYDTKDIDIDNLTDGGVYYKNEDIFLNIQTKKRSSTINVRRYSKVSKMFDEQETEEDKELAKLVNMKSQLYSGKKLLDM
jgi:hypothetical protein